MRKINCPNCGAGIEVPDNNAYSFCTYCGSKIDMIDRRSATSTRIIDDAKVKEAETQAQVRLAELDALDKIYNRACQQVKFLSLILIALSTIALLSCIILGISTSMIANTRIAIIVYIVILWIIIFIVIMKRIKSHDQTIKDYKASIESHLISK